MGITRLIKVDELTDIQTYQDWQPLYLDYRSGRPIPNTTIEYNSETLLYINSLGCKGPELTDGKSVIGVFGASETFGVSMDPRSWVDEIKLTNFQTLNAGVEGYNMQSMLERYHELSEQVKFDTVLVYAGWHNIIYGENSPDFWEKTLDQFAGDHSLGFFSLATPLTEECRERGLDELLFSESPREEYANYFEYNLGSLGKDYFNFWANREPTIENVAEVYDAVFIYNSWLRDYTEKRGYTLINLNEILSPKSYQEAPLNFYDVCHIRPTAYQKVGHWVGNELKKELKVGIETTPEKPKESIFKRILKGTNKPSEEDLRKNIYPLW